MMEELSWMSYPGIRYAVIEGLTAENNAYYLNL